MRKFFSMHSIATKLTLAFVLLGITGAFLVAILLQLRVRSAFDEFILNRDQQSLVEDLSDYYRTNGGWKNFPNAAITFLGTGHSELRRSFTRFTLVGADRTVIYSNFRYNTDRVLTNQELDQAIAIKSGNQVVGWVILTPLPKQLLPNSPESIFLNAISRATILSALSAAGLALLLGSLLAFTLTRSLREMKEVTQEIAQGKFGRQVKVRSKDELGELALSFNKMSLDLARATELRKQMTADIAHDLRTPISIISGYAEALSDGVLPGTPEVYTILYQETQHLSRLVDDLRTLTLADSGELNLIKLPTQPAELLNHVASRHLVTAQQKDIQLIVDAGGDLAPVSMDPERISQVLDNLINNAFRYVNKGGKIVLSARQSERDTILQIHDNGSGIRPEDLSHIFDRFYRGDTSRQHTGESGLGLAIAKSIVEAHGGSILAENAPEGGALFTIRLPHLL